VVSAAPAAANIVTLKGGSTTTRGCNGDARVQFDLVVLNGQYRKVKDFSVFDFGFPNLTPPIPYGHPRGRCIPGFDSYPICPETNMGPCAAPFGNGRKEDRFAGVHKHGVGNTILSWEGYLGSVDAKRVGRRGHRHWRYTAEGIFVIAISEGGLKYGGSSTDSVKWKAHN
jgi:hypothetical protein